MITVLIRYKGRTGQAKAFAKEMVASGLVGRIRAEEGNLRYEYYFPLDDEETVLLVDSWRDQSALDVHHHLPLMGEIARLRDKYDLHMEVEKYGESLDEGENEYVRK